MNVPAAPTTYEPRNEASFREIVKRAIDGCFNRNGDVEIGKSRVILTDTVDGTRYSLTVASGAVTLVAV